MGNSFGNRFRFTIFGQSHAPAIGVTVEGLPVGFRPDMEKLQAFLDCRAPGRNRFSTARREADVPQFISGLAGGAVCGAPVTALIFNGDTRSKDYSELMYIPRPGHADYPAMVKYGSSRDFAGGGQFSGRLTAPLCIAGGLAMQVLEGMGIGIDAEIVEIGGDADPETMFDRIDEAREQGDSVGGVVRCVCMGVPAGVGEPMFGGLENRISCAVFGIPAVKGIDFGAGLDAAKMRGSENNDPFFFDAGTVKTSTNNHGGILGGISTGMPIVFRAFFKPTPSIAKPQRSVNIKTAGEVELQIVGRHDPCIVPRAVPCVEAAAAVALYDTILDSRG